MANTNVIEIEIQAKIPIRQIVWMHVWRLLESVINHSDVRERARNLTQPPEQQIRHIMEVRTINIDVNPKAHGEDG